MFSIISKNKFQFFSHIFFQSANAFNLDQSKIFSFSTEVNIVTDNKILYCPKLTISQTAQLRLFQTRSLQTTKVKSLANKLKLKSLADKLNIDKKTISLFDKIKNIVVTSIFSFSSVFRSFSFESFKVKIIN